MNETNPSTHSVTGEASASTSDSLSGFESLSNAISMHPHGKSESKTDSKLNNTEISTGTRKSNMNNRQDFSNELGHLKDANITSDTIWKATETIAKRLMRDDPYIDSVTAYTIINLHLVVKHASSFQIDGLHLYFVAKNESKDTTERHFSFRIFDNPEFIGVKVSENEHVKPHFLRTYPKHHFGLKDPQ